VSASVTTTLSSPVNQPPVAVARHGISGFAEPPAPPGFAGGGGERIRTDDLLLAKQALSQLSYTPFRNREPGIRLFPDT
jgi:hypothetical protein